jgi:hypothetical protein
MSLKEPYASNPAIPGIFDGFTSYKNEMVGAVSEQTGHLEFRNFKMVDNMDAGIEMTYTQDSEPWKSVGVFDSVIVGKSVGNSDGYAMNGVQGIITA